MFIVSASGGQKHNFGQILTFGGLPIRAKFGVAEQTLGVHLHAKFHLNVFTVSASGGQKHNFGQILTFWGLLYRLPFIDEGKIWCAIADPWYTLTPVCVSIGLLCRPLGAKNIFSVFCI